MLIALVVVILTPAAFAQSAAGVHHASPAAKGIGEPSESLTDTTGGGGNTEHCGPIDPGTPCYSSGGSTTCPANTSYAKCNERCECQYQKNLKACKASGPCRDLAVSEKDACLGGCIADWS
jgi:hypothetical protein